MECECSSSIFSISVVLEIFQKYSIRIILIIVTIQIRNTTREENRFHNEINIVVDNIIKESKYICINNILKIQYL